MESRFKLNYQDHLEVSIGDDKVEYSIDTYKGYPSKICEVCDGQGILQALGKSKKASISKGKGTWIEDGIIWVPYGDSNSSKLITCPVCGGVGRLYLDPSDMTFKRIQDH